MRSFSSRLLIGRLLTRSGDQAWDFVVPLALLKLFPGELRVAALYFLIIRLFLVVLLPRVASLIDRMNRLKAARLGISLQLLGVLVGLLSFYRLSTIEQTHVDLLSPPALLAFVVLVFGGILGSVGSSFMDISIANDLVPSGIDEKKLSKFNSRLRQVDLLTEVASPVLAGLLLTIGTAEHSFLGFYLVGLWNLISFFPEYGILSSIFRDRPDLREKPIEVSSATQISFIKKIANGWRLFFKEPVALVVTAYAVLWLSVLSPHGVLLTAFLKDGWQLPEWEIGIFRGLGAFFGLGATLIFPRVEKRFGLIGGTRLFVIYQALMVTLALSFFYIDSRVGQIGFLAFILLSRIGMYGFSLGEMQIRQIGIRAQVRGEVNGFASALTGVATLGLFTAGVFVPSTEDFAILIIFSVASVIIASVIYSVWVWKNSGSKILSQMEPNRLKNR